LVRLPVDLARVTDNMGHCTRHPAGFDEKVGPLPQGSGYVHDDSFVQWLAQMLLVGGFHLVLEIVHSASLVTLDCDEKIMR